MQDVTFEDILASLDKDTRAGLRIGSDITKEVIPTPSFRLNKLLDGGLRKGKQHTFWGGEQSAKTAFTLQTVGIAQQLGFNVAWIDAENSFDPEWASNLGVDPDRLLISREPIIGNLTDLQIKLIGKGFDMIVIDSTGALIPRSMVDKEGELKDFADTYQLGAVAKDLGQMCKMVQAINYTAAIVHISQARVDVGSPAMTKPFKPIGGKEVEHADSLRIRFSSSKSDDKQIKEKVQRGNLLVEENTGFPVNYFVNKNKINGNYGNGAFDFYRNNSAYGAGLDRTGEVLDLAVQYGLVIKKGAWFDVYDVTKQGRAGTVAYLKENPQIAEKIEAELNAQ